MTGEKKTAYIYGLVDPTDNIVKYVGSTINPLARWSEHCNEIPYNTKGDWIKKLRKKGKRPYMVLFKFVYISKSKRMENYYIWLYRETVLNKILPNKIKPKNITGAKK